MGRCYETVALLRAFRLPGGGYEKKISSCESCRTWSDFQEWQDTAQWTVGSGSAWSAPEKLPDGFIADMRSGGLVHKLPALPLSHSR